MIKRYNAMVLSFIDPRFHSRVYNYLKPRKLSGKYSFFTIAGVALGVTHVSFKKRQKKFFIENLLISIRLHKINSLIAINHKDYGAAKFVNGNKRFDEANENKIHKYSFKKLKDITKRKFLNLNYEFYLMTLKGSIKNF